MSSDLLTEYRCPCGKLLFKGLLCQCIVAIKCRRCGEVTTWGLAESLPYALLESGADACVTHVSGNAEDVLGYEPTYLIGRQISELFPLLRDAPKSAEPFYKIESSPQLLRDGRNKKIESCAVPCFRSGKFAGYRVFSVQKKD